MILFRDPAFVVCNYEKGPVPKPAPRRPPPEADATALRLADLEEENGKLHRVLTTSFDSSS